MPNVNPEILRWARETAGVELEEAARKIQLRDSGKGTAVERLEALERGEEAPTRAMLGRMAKAYRRPLVVFYLSDPPPRGDRGEDFRSLPVEPPEDEEAHLDTLLRRVKARQRLLRAVLEDEDEAEPLPFVGSMTMGRGVVGVAESIRTALGVSAGELRRQPGVTEAFALLRDRTEEAGVFVLLIGDLGSHHTALDPEVFRGFALADPVAPFVVINARDSRAAWSFTLLHELAHLWLGQTGVSGGPPESGIEQFCNDVASRFLVSPEEVARVAARVREPGGDGAAAVLGRFAREWKVSRSLLAYRLYREGHITRPAWRTLDKRFRETWYEDQQRSREEARKREGGPDYYVVRRHRLGPTLIELTARMLASGALSTTRAGRILDVRPANVGRLVREGSAPGPWR
jgi:Zn-dependent peptidase ImmA (M78 family)